MDSSNASRDATLPSRPPLDHGVGFGLRHYHIITSRRKKMARAVHILVMVVLFASIASAGNWPQWRGPNLNGFSNEKNLPSRWTTEENVVWKLPMPSLSGSTPIIWRDRIFLNVA